MSTTEAQRQISQMIAALKAEAPNIALRMAQSGLTLVKERSIRDGITANGAFAEYSTKPVYKSSFKTKARNGAGSAYAGSGGTGNWGEFRGAQGLKSDRVNAFYSGRMWTSLRVIAQTQNGYRYSVLTGPSDAEATDVLLGNLKRYGNFLTLTAVEVRQIQEDASEDVRDIVNQYV